MPRKTKTIQPKSIYSVHPGVHLVMSWIASLKEKTGRSLEEWLDHIQTDGPDTEEERRDWLKQKYKLGINTAWWLAERSFGKGSEEDSPEAYLEHASKYVDAMFVGKEALLPIYEALLQLGQSLGKDVKFCPCKTIVPFYRQYVFAQVKPTTKTRIDFGLALRDTPATGRLIDTGGFRKKDRITHRIPISSLEDIDHEVESWLQVAYDRN